MEEKIYNNVILKKKLKEKGISTTQIAAAIGMCERTISYRFSKDGESRPFDINELYIIKTKFFPECKYIEEIFQ